MGLSSNSIIHFTMNLKSLNGILRDNFKIKYCRETIKTKNDVYDFLVPVVSFCDIPFSQITSHLKNYGSYGIGMKKSWAEKNGLNPVLYVEEESNLANNFFTQLFKKISDGKSTLTQDELSLEEKFILDIVRYMKNYEGDLVRIGKKAKMDYRFSDEREWRYVLKPEEEYILYGNLITIKNQPKMVNEAKMQFNLKIDHLRLDFEPDDINYIIIKSEKERDSVIRNLKMVKGKYPHEQVERLTSRIMSVEQILTDF